MEGLCFVSDKRSRIHSQFTVISPLDFASFGTLRVSSRVDT